MKRIAGLLLAVLLLLIVGMLVWQRRLPPGGAPSSPAISPELAQRMASEIPLAVASLENNSSDEVNRAVELLSVLDRELPHDPTILQNLVIGHCQLLEMAKKSNASDRIQQAADATAVAIQKLQAVSPDDWRSYALGGWMLEVVDDMPGAYQQYELVAPISTSSNQGDQRPATRIGDVTMLYAMARTGLSLPEGPDRQRARDALALASEKDPENFWILRDLMMALSEAKDLRLAQGLDRLMAIMPVVESSIKRSNPYFAFRDELQKLIEMVDEVQSNPGDATRWKKIQLSCRMVSNAFYSEEAAQSDRNYLTRHPLDFIATTLPPAVTAVLEQQGAAGRKNEASSQLNLEWAPVALPDALRDLADVKQVRMLDMTLDMRPEMCVLAEGKFSIWSRGTDSSWSLLSEHAAAAAHGFVLTDLDDDSQPITIDNDPSGVKNLSRVDLDVVLYGPMGVQLIQNTIVEGKRALVAWPAENSQALLGSVTVAESSDLDLDGDMDLVLAGDFGIRLGFNTGQPSFFVRVDTPVQVPTGLSVTQLLPCDLDRDQDQDVLVVSGGQVFLLESLRHANLRWKSIQELSSRQDVTQVRVLDADANASWDLLIASRRGISLSLGQTPESGKWIASSPQPLDLESSPCEKCRVADLDNNGAEDVISVGAGGVLSRWTRQTNSPPTYSGYAWEKNLSLPAVIDLHFADIDHDGDLDGCLAGASSINLLENKTGQQNAWLNLEVVGEQVKSSNAVTSGRVNHFGVGSLLEIRGSAGYQARLVNEEPPHFGLGPQGDASIARLVWPNGFPVNVMQPKPNQTLWEIQTLTGSCPYLYAWDGNRYVFLTDLLWAAPLGMPSPSGGMTPMREWEYLKIPGELCLEQDGHYTLQLTEELYEAAYFDHVQLMAVDHPADIAIYSNEKVGPPSIAGKQIHTVREPRLPASAIDQAGRDLLPEIRDLDEIYTKHWDRKHAQGWTEKTTLELDLGTLPDNAAVKLFLTGWVYPTDPAISVSIQQAPELAGFGIQPPSLEVPDGQGGWKLASPYIGFPGGKTKTIVVDLTGLLAPGDGRLRLVTSMELSWDQIFFTVNEPAAEVQETPLELISADLHFRGCSERVTHPQQGPERYDYSQVGPMIFQKMRGHFTRYGDVRELLTSRDDRQLVMGCGDECTLKFKALPAVPIGWKRDFLIYNVGWDKDNNMQNTYSTTVEPLPYQGMQHYPPTEPFPDDELHRDYLRKYQTRQQSDHHFRRFLFAGDSPSPQVEAKSP